MKKITKRALSLLLSLVLALAVLPSMVSAADYENHWAKAQAEALIEKGIVTPDPGTGNVNPNRNLTRAEMARLINQAFGLTAKGDISQYSDVPADAWFAEDIAIAVNAGFLSGYQDGTMKPNGQITRQEVASVASRFMKLTENPAASESYTDAAAIGAWAKGYVGAVKEAGIMTGDPNGAFRPTANITRAESFVVLIGMMGEAEAEEPVEYPDVTIGQDDTYGNADTVTTVKNLVIDGQNTKVVNVIVKGDLTITERVGEGTVTLQGVSVEGTTYVKGGGPNSLVISDTSQQKSLHTHMIVTKSGITIRLQSGEIIKITWAAGSNGKFVNESGKVALTIVNTKGEVIFTGSFEEIQTMMAEGNIRLSDATAKLLSILKDAVDGKITNDSDSAIDKVIVDALSRFYGTGVIGELVANVPGITIQKKPAVVSGPNDVIIDSGAAAGGGGGSQGDDSNTSSTPSIRKVEVLNDTKELHVTMSSKFTPDGEVSPTASTGFTLTKLSDGGGDVPVYVNTVAGGKEFVLTKNTAGDEAFEEGFYTLVATSDKSKTTKVYEFEIDTNAAVISYPEVTRTGESTAEFSYEVDKGGRLYWVVVENNDEPPSADNILNGKNHEGDNALIKGNRNGAADRNTVEINGLPAGIFDFYYIFVDTFGNISDGNSSDGTGSALVIGNDPEEPYATGLNIEVRDLSQDMGAAKKANISLTGFSEPVGDYEIWMKDAAISGVEDWLREDDELPEMGYTEIEPDDNDEYDVTVTAPSAGTYYFVEKKVDDDKVTKAGHVNISTDKISAVLTVDNTGTGGSKAIASYSLNEEAVVNFEVEAGGSNEIIIPLADGQTITFYTEEGEGGEAPTTGFYQTFGDVNAEDGAHTATLLDNGWLCMPVENPGGTLAIGQLDASAPAREDGENSYITVAADAAGELGSFAAGVSYYVPEAVATAILAEADDELLVTFEAGNGEATGLTASVTGINIVGDWSATDAADGATPVTIVGINTSGQPAQATITGKVGAVTIAAGNTASDLGLLITDGAEVGQITNNFAGGGVVIDDPANGIAIEGIALGTGGILALDEIAKENVVKLSIGSIAADEDGLIVLPAGSTEDEADAAIALIQKFELPDVAYAAIKLFDESLEGPEYEAPTVPIPGGATLAIGEGSTNKIFTTNSEENFFITSLTVSGDLANEDLTFTFEEITGTVGKEYVYKLDTITVTDDAAIEGDYSDYEDSDAVAIEVDAAAELTMSNGKTNGTITLGNESAFADATATITENDTDEAVLSVAASGANEGDITITSGSVSIEGEDIDTDITIGAGVTAAALDAGLSLDGGTITAQGGTITFGAGLALDGDEFSVTGDCTIKLVELSSVEVGDVLFEENFSGEAELTVSTNTGNVESVTITTGKANVSGSAVNINLIIDGSIAEATLADGDGAALVMAGGDIIVREGAVVAYDGQTLNVEGDCTIDITELEADGEGITVNYAEGEDIDVTFAVAEDTYVVENNGTQTEANEVTLTGDGLTYTFTPGGGKTVASSLSGGSHDNCSSITLTGAGLALTVGVTGD